MPSQIGLLSNRTVLPLHTNHFGTEKVSAAISKLPPELLGLILLTVYKNDGSRSLANALRVTRYWHEVGNAILWQHLILADSSIEKFANVVGRVDDKPSPIDRIDSLTLEIVSPDEGNCTQNPFARNMHKLALLLPSMTSLHSFSVTSRYGVYSPWLTKQATDDVIIDLVSRLPGSIQHLEIDLQIAYFPRLVPQSCLCEVISERLEGLQSLRLRWPRVCSKLFGRPSTTLTHVSMDYTGAGMSPYVRGCTSARSNSRMSWDELQQQSHRLSQAAVRDVLSPLRANPQKFMPHIQHLVIIEPHHFWPLRSNHQWFLLNTHIICEARSPRLVTTSYTVWPTGFVEDGQYQFIIRYCTHDKPDQSRQDLNHDCSDTDRHGSGRAMCRIFEDTAGWATNDTGARRPLTTQRKVDLDIASIFLNKPQWQALYKQKREAELFLEFNDEFIREPGPTADLEADIEAVKDFQRDRKIKAAMVGADYIWFLEERLGHNVLCARIHPDGFPNESDEMIQERFTSSKDLLREVQRDVPWDP